MTITEFVNTFLYGLDGQEKVPFDRIVALLEHLAEKVGGTQDLTAGAAGVAVIGAGTGWLNITAGTNADAIVHLPAVAGIKVGHVIRGSIGATGCEIRVAVADDTVVYLNNNNTTVNEAALGANCSFKAVYAGANRWILTFFAIDGTESAATIN